MKPLPAGGPSARLNLTWVAAFVLLALLIGFRYEVGGDWFSYLAHIEAAQGEPLQVEGLANKDFLFGLLNWFGANVYGGIYFVNFVCAVIFSWGLITFCRIQSRPWLALLVATPYLITVVAMGYTRQGVAIGLVMLAIASLMNHSLLRFICWITVAALFHKSAVILVPLALFAESNKRALTLFGVAFFTAILFVSVLQEHVDGLIKNYIEAEYESSGAAFRIAMNALPAALFLIFNKRFKTDPKTRGFWKWVSWSALVFVPLLVISPSSTAVDRVALYWIPLQLFVWSGLPAALSSRNNGNSLCVWIISIYCVAIMVVWLNFSVYAKMWVPYRFYPWVALWA